MHQMEQSIKSGRKSMSVIEEKLQTENQRFSFYQLFKSYQYHVIIPIIQREYAQGREKEDEVRTQFLTALYSYLEDGEAFHDLDFIYGTVENIDEKKYFIPLDGQQRLTTLFLLHWYLYAISDCADLKEEYKNTLVKDNKSLFSYKTRQSSTDFCDALMTNHIEITEEKPSEVIKNKSWYFRSWQFDPTICGMLTMLDAIHKKFYGKKDFFARLLNMEKPAITFLFMNLEEFKLTDNLYIKMNSRGKQLTPFENFKSQYSEYLKTVKTDRTFKLSNENDCPSVSMDKYFLHCIDTIWTDMVWGFRDIDKKGNIETYHNFDQKLANLIQNIFIWNYAERFNIKTDTLRNLQTNKEQGKNIRLSLYSENFLNEKSALFLLDCFDTFYQYIGKSDKLHLLPAGHVFNEYKAFQNALRSSFASYAEQICLYAYIIYLIKFNNSGEKTPAMPAGLDEWMRIIYNLANSNNTITDSITEFAQAIKSIRDMLNEISEPHHVLQHFVNIEKITRFSPWQVKEEKIKSCLLLREANFSEKKWRKKITETEKHTYFTGQIGFILSFAGIIQYYDKHQDCNWSEKENTKYFDAFSDYAEKAAFVFAVNDDNSWVNNSNYCFERAVLTKGDYLLNAGFSGYYIYKRKNALSSTMRANNIFRDNSWRRFLRLTDNDKEKQKQSYVQAVFDDERFNLTAASLEKICEEFCQNEVMIQNENSPNRMWRNTLIQHPQCFALLNQGFINFKQDKSSILLLKESQLNHLHAELYSYALWHEQQEFKILQKKFKGLITNKGYYITKSIESVPYIWLEMQYNNAVYYLYISVQQLNNYQLEHYNIELQNEDATPKREEYKKEFLNYMETLSFKWDSENQCFSQKVEAESILEFLTELCSALSE